MEKEKSKHTSGFYLFFYVEKFSEIWFIINKMIAEGYLDQARIILINQIIYSMAYRGVLDPEKDKEGFQKRLEDLSKKNIAELQAIYALEQKKLGVGPRIDFVGGESFIDRVLKAARERGEKVDQWNN